MKKIFISAFVVLLFCCTLICGCAKADTASLLDCYNMYMQMTQTYSQANKYLFNNTNNVYVDLYSQDAYNQYAYQAITAEQGNFKLLKYGNQYQVLTSVALSFYNKYDTYLNTDNLTNYEDKASQQQKTKLYNSIQKLNEVCQNVINNKSTLLTLCYQDFNVENINVLHNLDSFIKSYKVFIENALNVSADYEDIYTNGILTKTENSISVLEGTRLLESSKLYIAKYVYLTYFKNQEVFYDCSTQQIYLDLVDIINSNAINFSTEPSQQDLRLYNFLCDKLSAFKTGVKNYEIALNNQQNNVAYQNYVQNFKTEVQNFIATVKANLIDA